MALEEIIALLDIVAEAIVVGLLLTPDQSTEPEITALVENIALDEIVADGLLMSTHAEPVNPRHLALAEL